jgi:hypothetical protein
MRARQFIKRDRFESPAERMFRNLYTDPSYAGHRHRLAMKIRAMRGRFAEARRVSATRKGI